MTKKLKNPNRLEGHEGYLVKTRQGLGGYFRCINERYRNDPSSWGEPIDIPSESIGMIVSCDDSNDSDRYYDWVDFLWEDRVYRLFFPHNQWMHYLIPWPHGAFIHQD